jgi:hypothetical protein
MSPRIWIAALISAAALAVAGCGSSSSTSSSAASASSASDSATTSASSASASATTSASSSGPVGVAPLSSSSTTSTSSAAANAPGPEGIPLEPGPELAPASTTSPGTTVDGIQCAPIEQLAYHIHAHLQVYVDGKPRSLPPAIGMIEPIYENTPNGRFYGAEKCYYWLHTHASDGVIHIESPTPRIYTLGNFFDEWRQPLSDKQVGPATGKVTAIVNGKPWKANVRDIPLSAHNVIQLSVGTPVVPFQNVSFAGTGL